MNSRGQVKKVLRWKGLTKINADGEELTILSDKMESESKSFSVMSDSLQPHGLYVACLGSSAHGIFWQEYWSG